MTRRVLFIASVLSLLLCLATVTLGVLSYRRSVAIGYERLGEANSRDNDPPADKLVSLSVAASDGLFVFERRFVFEPYGAPRRWPFSCGPAVRFRVQHAGFMYDESYPRDVVASCPCWAVAGLAAITSLGAFALRRSSRVSAFPICPSCEHPHTPGQIGAGDRG
ncbi:MAG TPA: hypothetical protein VGI81_27955 [Tepidisphaeraceae bacterium]